MGKQSMGTPVHTWDIQAETKLYRLLLPSSPLFRPGHYDAIKLDDFPMGVNAVVAVISYTVRNKSLSFNMVRMKKKYKKILGIRYGRRHDYKQVIF